MLNRGGTDTPLAWYGQESNPGSADPQAERSGKYFETPVFGIMNPKLEPEEFRMTAHVNMSITFCNRFLGYSLRILLLLAVP